MLQEDKLEKSISEVIVYLDMGRYPQAIDKLEQLLSESPNNGNLLYLMANCYYNLDSYEEAIDYCKESMEKGFSIEACSHLLGRIYMDKDQFVESEKHFLEVLRINPSNASALSAYGMLMLRTGHDKKASALMDEAMRIDPEDEVVLHYKFLYQLFKGNKNAQIDLLQRYYNNAGSEVRKLLNTGIFYLNNNNYMAARESLRQAFLLDPTNKDILIMLEELDKQCHIIFLPNRLIDKLGGPAVIWVVFFSFLVLARNVLDSTTLVTVALIYIFISVYTWISSLLYKIVVKIKRE